MNFWAPRYQQARWKNISETPLILIIPVLHQILTMVIFIPIFQYRSNENQSNWEAELVYPMSGAVQGMTFRANEPNILYIMMRATSTFSPNTLISIDVTDPENTFRKLIL